MPLQLPPISKEQPIEEIIAAGVAAKTSDENHVVIPQGYTLEPRNVEQFEPAPRRKRALVQFDEVGSFCHYVKDHYGDNPNAVIFCALDKACFVCVFDYHGTHADHRAWGEHRAVLQLKESREWVEWTGFNRQKKNQIEFGEFLEQNIQDVVRPDGASLLEMCLEVTAVRSADFKSATRISNGQVQFAYVEQISAQNKQGEMVLPERFTVRIPVFQGGPLVDVEALLRYRIASGGLTLWYDLLRPDRIKQEAVNHSAQSIENETEMTVLRGLLVSMGL